MKRIVHSFLFLAFFILSGWAQLNTETIRMACIDNSITYDSIPVINRTTKRNKLQAINLHTPQNDMKKHFLDKAHPDTIDVHKTAEVLYPAIPDKKGPHQLQSFPGLKSQWNGYDRYDFQYEGHDAIVVIPKRAAKGNPWIWRPAFFNAFPSVDKALLEKGFHVVFYNLTHSYGNPRAVTLGTKFYHYLTTYYSLSPKVTLEGFSRGGLYVLNWAYKNTDKIACIYLDAPVCDVFSWPGRKKAELWNDLLKEWQLTDETMTSFKGNPIDNLEPLAKAGIPIISVCGDADQVVPLKENMDVLRSRYLALGGIVELIIKPNVDHHPHSLENPDRLSTLSSAISQNIKDSYITTHAVACKTRLSSLRKNVKGESLS